MRLTVVSLLPLSGRAASIAYSSSTRPSTPFEGECAGLIACQRSQRGHLLCSKLPHFELRCGQLDAAAAVTYSLSTTRMAAHAGLLETSCEHDCVICMALWTTTCLQEMMQCVTQRMFVDALQMNHKAYTCTGKYS